jgi:hypothetical protein
VGEPSWGGEAHAWPDTCHFDVERTVLTSPFKTSLFWETDSAFRVVWVASADRKSRGGVEVMITV